MSELHTDWLRDVRIEADRALALASQESFETIAHLRDEAGKLAQAVAVDLDRLKAQTRALGRERPWVLAAAALSVGVAAGLLVRRSTQAADSRRL